MVREHLQLVLTDRTSLTEGQDFGVLAFNGWDGFQDVVSEFLGFVDWRCGTELDFADDGLFSCGK